MRRLVIVDGVVRSKAKVPNNSGGCRVNLIISWRFCRRGKKG